VGSEGRSSAREASRDLAEHGVGVVEDALIFQAEDREPLRFQVGIAFGVVLFALGGVVGLAVAFDDEFGVVAVEVAEVIAGLVLATELRVAELAVAQEFPEKILGRSLILS
jgi:hypothetical protein